jgi:hypothetical protein
VLATTSAALAPRAALGKLREIDPGVISREHKGSWPEHSVRPIPAIWHTEHCVDKRVSEKAQLARRSYGVGAT